MKKYILYFSLLSLVASCALQNQSIKSNELKEIDNTSVSIDTSVNLTRTGYIRSCVKANKFHAPKRSWLKACRLEAQEYIDEIYTFLNLKK